MFDPQPEPAAPLRPEKSKVDYQLGPNGRCLPPPLEVENEKYLVELTGEDDPANAKSWPFSRKLRTAAVLGFDTLVASWGSSVYASATTPITQEFGVGSVVAILGLTLYICGK